MDIEKEKNKKPLGLEEARELLAEAWLDFWSGSRTPYDGEIRKRRISQVLEKLSPSGKEYFLHEEEDRDSKLAEIREGAKVLARTGKRTPSAGERLHIRRQKVAKRGTDPKRIH